MGRGGGRGGGRGRERGGGEPLPEPVLLEEEGAVLNGNALGLHKQQGHQDGLHNHTACKEEEGAPLHCTLLTVRNQLKLTAWDPTKVRSAGLVTSA